MKVAFAGPRPNILGRGAVKDTCNLLADVNAFVNLLRVRPPLPQLNGINVGQWAKSQGYGIDTWAPASEGAKRPSTGPTGRRGRGLLAGITCGDGDRPLELSRQAQGELPEDSAERQRIVDAAELLGRLLLKEGRGAD